MHGIRLTGLFCQAFLFCVCESLAGRRLCGQPEAGIVRALSVRGGSSEDQATLATGPRASIHCTPACVWTSARCTDRNSKCMPADAATPSAAGVVSIAYAAGAQSAVHTNAATPQRRREHRRIAISSKVGYQRRWATHAHRLAPDVTVVHATRQPFFACRNTCARSDLKKMFRAS